METKTEQVFINEKDGTSGWCEVTVKLIRFPKKSLIEGVRRYNEFRRTKKDTIEKYKGIKLANYKSMWWIYYGKNHMTGSFDTKEKAISWFEKAGR